MKMSKFTALIVFVFLGGVYGFVCAGFNQNPYYKQIGGEQLPKKQIVHAWHWEPSLRWPTSYVLCKFPKNGLGICHTKSGYMFRSTVGEVIYFSVSTVLGSMLFVVLGMSIGKLVEKAKLKFRRTDHGY